MHSIHHIPSYVNFPVDRYTCGSPSFKPVELYTSTPLEPRIIIQLRVSGLSYHYMMLYIAYIIYHYIMLKIYFLLPCIRRAHIRTHTLENEHGLLRKAGVTNTGEIIE